MVTHNPHLLLDQALAHREELHREADLNRLLRGCQNAKQGHLDRLLAGLGTRLVQWGTKLQQRSTGATTPAFTI